MARPLIPVGRRSATFLLTPKKRRGFTDLHPVCDRAESGTLTKRPNPFSMVSTSQPVTSLQGDFSRKHDGFPHSSPLLLCVSPFMFHDPSGKLTGFDVEGVSASTGDRPACLQAGGRPHHDGLSSWTFGSTSRTRRSQSSSSIRTAPGTASCSAKAAGSLWTRSTRRRTTG